MQSVLVVFRGSGCVLMLSAIQVSGNLEKGIETGIENPVFECPSRFSLLSPSLSRLVSPSLAEADPVGDALGDIAEGCFLRALTEARRLTPFDQAPPFGTPFIC